MKEIEGLISLGRLMKAFGGSTRGALIHLEDSIAYMTNTKRSVLYKLTFNNHIGTGVFYAGEAPIVAEKIELRDEKVLFEWKDKKATRRVFVPSKPPVKEVCEKVLTKYYVEPKIRVPVEAIDLLDADILITNLQVKNNRLLLTQTRSDGTVSLQNEVPLSRGLAAVNYPDTGEVAIFTTDLYILKNYVTELYLDIQERKPVSVRAKLNFNATLKGVIAFLTYER